MVRARLTSVLITVSGQFLSKLRSRYGLACLVLVLVLTGATAAHAASNFVLVTLPRGIELQVPKGWWLLGPELNQAIETSAEAALDLSGLPLSEGTTTNLIAANSMPRSTYAAVRVDSTQPPPVAPQEFAALTAADVRELRQEMKRSMERLLQMQGSRLIEFLGTRIEKISGYPAIVTVYRRTGPKGPVLVEINQIFTPSQEIRVNLSYRESEAGLWKPVVEKIRRSIMVKH